MQRILTFYQQFVIFMFEILMLTNDIVNFEQLAPGLLGVGGTLKPESTNQTGPSCSKHR